MAGEKILVVDDEEAIREVISTLLDAQGFRCTTCVNGKVGLEAFRKDSYDLVLSDIVMPEMDGLKLLAELRMDDPDVPVIMVTAMHDISIALEAIRAGAYDYILKPFEKDQLYLSVRRALEHRRLVMENRTYQSDLEQLVAERTQTTLHRVAGPGTIVRLHAGGAGRRAGREGRGDRRTLPARDCFYDYDRKSYGSGQGAAAANRSRRFPPRYRQDGGARPDSAQTRTADAGRARNYAPALRHRVRRARKNSVLKGSGGDRAVAPGVLRRLGLSARTERRTDPARGQNIRGRRHA